LLDDEEEEDDDDLSRLGVYQLRSLTRGFLLKSRFITGRDGIRFKLDKSIFGLGFGVDIL
jgi:hypothetical protein